MNAVLHENVTRFDVSSSLKKKSSTFRLASGHGVQERCAAMCITHVDGNAMVKEERNDVKPVKYSCPETGAQIVVHQVKIATLKKV